MASATQRYLNYGLAKNDGNWTKRIFRTAMQIDLIIAFVIFVFGETLGLWFVMNKLIIPTDRMMAALWDISFPLLHQWRLLSIFLSMLILLLMNEFAYISIFEVVLKLLIVYLLLIVDTDKLIFYEFLFLCVQLFDGLLYGVYCRLHFQEVNFSLKRDDVLLKEMSGFAGWSLWGSIANILFTKGLNILLNMFFGSAVNAARGVAVQMQGAIIGFVGNIYVALNPQITKSYARNEISRMHSLIFASSKFCFFSFVYHCFAIIHRS